MVIRYVTGLRPVRRSAGPQGWFSRSRAAQPAGERPAACPRDLVTGYISFCPATEEVQNLVLEILTPMTQYR